MSIVISDLSYRFPNQNPLFHHLNFSVSSHEKVSLIESNGSGKSTLLKIISGHLQSKTGIVSCSSKPYYIPQQAGVSNLTIAEVLNIDAKLNALNTIAKGSLSQADYDALDNDWDIEARCRSALDYWHFSGENGIKNQRRKLPDIDLRKNIGELSGGERIKVLLAGLLIHKPEIVLLDEPSNDLDQVGRQLLYQFTEQSASTLLVVSHDVTLLNLLPVTCELSQQTIKRYGGNYSFYETQKELENHALNDDIHAEEKALRLARKKAQDVCLVLI